MALLPDLPMLCEYEIDPVWVSKTDLEWWAKCVLVLKYNEVSSDMADVYIKVRTWLNTYSAQFPEDNFDSAPLYLDILGWLYGFVDYLTGIS